MEQCGHSEKYIKEIGYNPGSALPPRTDVYKGEKKKMIKIDCPTNDNQVKQTHEMQCFGIYKYT